MSRRRLEQKREQRSENRNIRREMAWKTPVLAGMTETAAGDVEPAHFCRNDAQGEDHNGRAQNRKSAAIQKAKRKSYRTKNFQPRKIKRERDTDGPGQKFEIVDVAGELNRINCLQRTGVDENPGDDEVES